MSSIAFRRAIYRSGVRHRDVVSLTTALVALVPASFEFGEWRSRVACHVARSSWEAVHIYLRATAPAPPEELALLESYAAGLAPPFDGD